MAQVEPIPFSEPPWLSGQGGLPSPYYRETHRKFQHHCREFITENLTKHAMAWERDEEVPAEVYCMRCYHHIRALSIEVVLGLTITATFAKAGMLIPNLPAPLPVKWLKQVGIHQIGPVKVEDFDYNHIAIYVAELNRCGLGGPSSGITAGFRYGVPPLLHFADESLQQRVLPDLLLGKKRICIAISEPEAGSDVANVTTTAVKSKDGKSYTVNGSKKWITNGIWSDYASMCVRTGPPDSAAAGLSVLLVPLKGQKGVSMRKMKQSGQNAGGTTFIELDDVIVPAENLIGKESQGMNYIMVTTRRT